MYRVISTLCESQVKLLFDSFHFMFQLGGSKTKSSKNPWNKLFSCKQRVFSLVTSPNTHKTTTAMSYCRPVFLISLIPCIFLFCLEPTSVWQQQTLRLQYEISGNIYTIALSGSICLLLCIIHRIINQYSERFFSIKLIFPFDQSRIVFHILTNGWAIYSKQSSELKVIYT